jgi:4-phosphopantoate---beta-alanine ligase
MTLSSTHPRYFSLKTRDRMVKAVSDGIAAPQGLIAHGRGEAFDYILGERTSRAASRAITAAAALLITADRPVLSVNGNTAALAGKEMVTLSRLVSAPIEINLFHRTLRREHAVNRYLTRLGAQNVLGIGGSASQTVKGIASSRKMVDPRGIGSADVVLVPLEDGDRAEALKRAGKVVIAIDLNPLSRTSQLASISIVDNVVRTIPALITATRKMKRLSHVHLEKLGQGFDNEKNLKNTIQEIVVYLRGWMKK